MEVCQTVFEGRPQDGAGRCPQELACYDCLDRLGISYLRVDHEHADTIEACHAVEAVLGTAICKNLFLCNRQKTAFYLLMMEGEKVFKTKELSKQLGVSRLSFADAADMKRLLDLEPGSVSILGLLNDREHSVQLVMDRPIYEGERVGCHPCRNTSTLSVRTKDLLERFLPDVGHSVICVDLPEEPEITE